MSKQKGWDGDDEKELFDPLSLEVAGKRPTNSGASLNGGIE